MKLLGWLFNVPTDEFNTFDIRFGFDDTAWIVVESCLIVFALCFFWASLSRIRILWQKIALFGLRSTVMVFFLLVFTKLKYFRPKKIVPFGRGFKRF